MATPATLKKLDAKKAAADAKRNREQQQQSDGNGNNNNASGGTGQQLLSLSAQLNAPSSHLLVRSGAGGAAFSNYRERREDFSEDLSMERPYGQMHYTHFGTLQTERPPVPDYHQQNVLQPLSRPANYNTAGHAPRLPAAKVNKLEVLPFPDGMPTWKLTVHADKLVLFHGKTHFLSQLYPVTCVVDGNEYQSLEHYYQACKLFSLIGSQYAQELRNIKDPLKAKIRARELLFRAGVNNEKVELWKSTHGVLVLLHAMHCKFFQQPLRDQLLGTGDALLVQAYDKDTFFASGMIENATRQWATDNEGKVLEFPTKLSHENVKYLPLIGKGKNVLGAVAMHVRKQLREDENSKDAKEDVAPQPQQHDEPSAEYTDCDPTGLADTVSNIIMYADEEDVNWAGTGKENDDV